MKTDPTDTEILDWLSNQDCVNFQRHYQGTLADRTARERKTDGYNGRIDFFSIPSQHLKNVKDLRTAVKMAMRSKPRKPRLPKAFVKEMRQLLKQHIGQRRDIRIIVP